MPRLLDTPLVNEAKEVTKHPEVAVYLIGAAEQTCIYSHHFTMIEHSAPVSESYLGLNCSTTKCQSL